mmetsp:Transcript_18351/g.41987  ORF Transcript_18351/g.41987 Transcript_18351/m.41987 type:complete len:201 (-) Transcript_18351:459-1061(-)
MSLVMSFRLLCVVAHQGARLRFLRIWKGMHRHVHGVSHRVASGTSVSSPGQGGGVAWKHQGRGVEGINGSRRRRRVRRREGRTERRGDVEAGRVTVVVTIGHEAGKEIDSASAFGRDVGKILHVSVVGAGARDFLKGLSTVVRTVRPFGPMASLAAALRAGSRLAGFRWLQLHALSLEHDRLGLERAPCPRLNFEKRSKI